MPRAVDSGLRESILTLSKENYSIRKIVAVLEARNLIVSKSTVANIIEKFHTEENGYAVPAQHAKNCGKPKVRTPSLIKKVKRDIRGPNPLTQNQLARKHHTSQTTIHRIIHQDLGGKLRKKYRVHALSNAQVQQRLDRGPGFLRYIRGNKWKNILTVDEAWVYLTNVGGRRHVYYELQGERTEESWTKFWKVSHPNGVMFFAGVCSRGVTKLRFIEPGAKINSAYYIENCLKPLFSEDLPRLYLGEEHKVVFHQDSAPAHASKMSGWETRPTWLRWIFA